MTRLVRVTKPQARAMLALLRLLELPSTLDRHEKKALTHLHDRLQLAIDERSIHPLTEDLDRLEDVLLSARSRAFHDFIHGRLRDLLSVALLWTAAEELPAAVARPLLDVERLGDPGWPADVLEQCAAHGLRVSFPGDDCASNDDDRNDDGRDGDGGQP